MEKVVMVDPPEGWRYGFPRVFDPSKKSLTDMLKEVGYPEDLMNLALTYSRYWEEEV